MTALNHPRCLGYRTLFALVCTFLTLATAASQAPPERFQIETLTRTAQAAMAQGDSATAVTLLGQALALSPNNPAPNLALGEILLAQQRYPEAMDRFETVLAIDLRNPRARVGEQHAATRLAVQAHNAGHPEAALQCLQHAQAYLPKDPALLLDLALQADELRQFSLAETSLHAARQLSPADPAILYALARVELDQKHLPIAEQYLRQYIALRPDDASAHFGLGHVLVMDQRIPEAESEFRRSIALQPVQTESYYQLGQIRTDLRQDTVARPLLEKVIARDPRHGGALTALGVLDFRAKNYAEARQYLDRAVAVSPEYEPAHYYLGLTLARLGDKAASDHELRIATDLAHQAQVTRE